MRQAAVRLSAGRRLRSRAGSKSRRHQACTLDGEADHIFAARFLKRFVEHDTPWLHVDLSASCCEGGLGSVASDVWIRRGLGLADVAG